MTTTDSVSSNKRCDNQRFTDVSEEPDKILPPLPPVVQLHSSASSTSLCEAIKPIYHLVEDLPNRVAYSLEKCKNPKDTLTRDESAAIYLYTQQWPEGKISFYTMFNRSLRDENRAKLVPFHQYLNLFMSAFNKLPSIQDRVWRGETGDLGAHYKPDTVHVWWGVSSCTDKIHVTGDFLDETKKRTLFNIKCKNGKIIKNHSKYPDESETVLPPGTYFKVKSSLNATSDLCIVDLEEIVPTSEELAQLAAGAAPSVSSKPSSNPHVNNIYILWLDPNVNKSQHNKQTQEKLKQLFSNTFKPFEKLEEAIKYMQDNQNQRFLLITGGQIGKQIVPEVNDLSQLQFVVIYCMDKQANEKWSIVYEKVKAVVTQEDKMIETVQKFHKDLVEQQETFSTEYAKSGNNRLIDGTDQSQKQLPPIYDFQHQPLVSLEESLQAINDIIPELQKYVHTAMMNCESPAEGLTQSESAAIMIYTMDFDAREGSLCRLLNQDLHSESRHGLKKWFSYLKLFLHALNKLPSCKMTVWRGIKLDRSNSYNVGNTIVWWGVSTATSNMSCLESPGYIGYIGQHGTRTLFSIECTNGKCIREHSFYKDEEEILLLPGSWFEVKSQMDAGNGLRIIGLREIDSSHKLC